MYHFAKKIEDFLDNEKSEYSKFKHGSKSIARQFGKLLANSFVQTDEFNKILQSGKSIVICSAPHNNIPTASFTLKDYFISGLAGYLIAYDSIEIEETKIHRKHSYNTEYGEMSIEQRHSAINADSFHIDSEIVKGKHVIFVDDCRITGAHEDRIKTMIRNHNLEITSSFIYYAALTTSVIDPKIENQINHFSINRVEDILELMMFGEFTFNTRVIKKILRFNLHDVSFFIETILGFNRDWGQQIIDTLLTLATLNGYHKDETMIPGISLIRRITSDKKEILLT